MRIFTAFFLFITLTFSSAFAKENKILKKLTFDEFIEETKSHNLSLKVAKSKSDVSQAKAIGIKIPDPKVGYITRSDMAGNSANGVEFQQTIPFPSKITSDYEARKYEAKSQESLYLGVKSEVFAQARLIYFNLWQSQRFKEILKEKIKVIKDHVRLTRAIARSDSFLKVHLIKAESDLEFLDNELIKSDQQIKENAAIMAQFLDLDPNNFNPTLEEPPLIKLPTISDLEDPHQLEAKKFHVQSLKQREKEADAKWLPDFYVKYQDVHRTQMLPGYSMATVGVSLPFVFPWENHSFSKETVASSRQAQAEYRAEKRAIESQIKILFDKLDSLKRQLDNINNKLLPLAKKRLAIIRNLTPRDIPTLQEYRETTENFPDLKLEELRLRTKYEETAAAILQYERGIK